MSLIDCPECGAEISASAIACPKCGFPINRGESPDSPRVDSGQISLGIAGFLIVPALWLPLMVFRTLRSYISTGANQLSTVLGTSSEMSWIIKIGHWALLGLLSIAVFSFFKKQRQAPQLVIAALALEVILAVLIMMEFGRAFGQSGQSTVWRMSIPIFLGAAVLIPYFLRSQRVKVTFVR